ncbi:DUF397 domain-containing protein [Nocardia pseudobrasiliensis]|uniref:Uncharacterized protein DUF397 n=1 Tax=Nocardia pseudobrasiliensis TaxID=45979 RepID=A0A370I878_9NOCA|nr:DUF397 domain-containing protein [Nocardia pseudobrasiliensis]RDI66830.1 uncharacterized protein DUF397 [Nocardia pseudobrasiliensis]
MTRDSSGATWYKSSYSQSGGDCVETAFFESGLVGVRDSKNPGGPALMFAPSEWDAFTARVRRGEFDWH